MQNMTLEAFQETMFYLLTLNCMSFMLCKPPFSLSSLISSGLLKTCATAKPYKKDLICSHSQLFVAPYMYLFAESDGGWVHCCTKSHTACKFPPDPSLDQFSCDSLRTENLETTKCQNGDGFTNLINVEERKSMGYSCNSVDSENLETNICEDEDGSRNSCLDQYCCISVKSGNLGANRCKNEDANSCLDQYSGHSVESNSLESDRSQNEDGFQNSCLDQYSSNSVESESLETSKSKNEEGFRNLLNEKERRLMERAREVIKVLLKKNGKESHKHKIPKDDDFSRYTTEEEIQGREILKKSRDWGIKKRYQEGKRAIQRARDEIVRKKYESHKLCRSQIRLLGKKFLEKSLQQGMEIQQQLAIADRILRSAQNRDLPQPTSANSIQN